MLKDMFMLGLMHKLVLERSTTTKLKRIDISIRQYARIWLKLSHDVPLKYFYAPCGDGGFRVTVPSVYDSIAEDESIQEDPRKRGSKNGYNWDLQSY